MKKLMVIAGAATTAAVVSAVIAFSQTGDPVLDPDPQINAVMKFIGMTTPPTDPKTRELMRSHYATLPQPTPGVLAVGGNGNPPPMPLPPEGCLGTQVRLWQPDDALQKTAGQLVAAQPVPTERAAHFASVLQEVDFLGWQVDVRNAKTAEGMTTVTVQTYPLVRTREGCGASVFGALEETWEVKGQTATLVKTKTFQDAYVFDGN
jgi:hypothetical protein